MPSRLRSHVRHNVVGYLALFIALSGTAYAANTVGSSDIIDESILSQDIKNGQVQNADVGANAIGTGKIADQSVFSADIRDDTLSGGGLAAIDLQPNSVGTSEVQDNSLTPADFSGGAIQGNGRLLSNRTTASTNQTVFVLDVPGFFQIFLACGNGSSFNNVAYRSQSSEQLEVYFDNGSTDPARQVIAGGDTTTTSNSASPGGEMNTIQVSSPTGKILTAWVTSAWRGSDCVVNAFGSFMNG